MNEIFFWKYQQINFYLEGNIMEVTIRESSEKDLDQMIVLCD